jgi:hypothetical protein
VDSRFDYYLGSEHWRKNLRKKKEFGSFKTKLPKKLQPMLSLELTKTH